MSSKVKKNDTVEWSWGKGRAKGKVTAVASKKTTKTLQGATITRKGTKDDPALTITQSTGKKVLKKQHEVKKK